MALIYSYIFITLIVSIHRPIYGFALLLISITYRFQDRTEISIPIFLILLCCVFLGYIINKGKDTTSYPTDKLILFLFIFSIAGLAIRQPSAILHESWQFMSSIMVYFFATRLIKTKSDLIVIIYAVSVCTVYLGYEAITSILADPSSIHWARSSTGVIIEKRRLQGIGYYANPNEFGSLMIWPIPLLVAATVESKNKLFKILLISIIVALMFVMFKTLSRTVMATLFIMSIFWFIFISDGDKMKLFLKIAIMATVTLLLVSSLPGPIKDRIDTIADYQTDESFQGRTRSWSYGIQMLTWYPVFGTGKGQWIEHHGLMPHNSFIQILSELSLIGFLVFLNILKHAYRSIFSSLKKAKENELIDKYFITAIGVTFTGYLIYIFFGNQGYSYWTYFYIGLCMSATSILNHSLSGMKTSSLKEDKQARN